MKKTLLLSALSLLFLGTLVSCESDPEFDTTETITPSDDQFNYDSEGVWTENNQPGFLNIQGYEFSHIVDNLGYVYGFTPSKVSNASKPNTALNDYPYASASGGGVCGPGSQYLVGYWSEYLETKDLDPGEECPFDNRSCRIYANDGDTFEPQSVMVCNNTYVKYAALDGTTFTPPFKAGDNLILIAHGVHMDGTEKTVSYHLINIQDSDVSKGILSEWAKFDLSDLGECTGVYFTMDSNDNPNLKDPVYGLNIPAYFCISQFVVKD